MAKDFSIRYQDMTNLVPSQLRNPTSVTLIDNLFNRFLTKDEAIPLYGFVGLPPSDNAGATLPRIKQLSLDRAVNALIPAFTFNIGAETFTFTPQDVIRRTQVLGSSSNQATWLYSQFNNYSPPINLDKFVNFYNYYWVAKAEKSVPSLDWNLDLNPEYYVIAKPPLDALDKLNVKTATVKPVVLTGSGFYDQTWILSFIGANSVTVSAIGPLVGFLAGQNVQTFTLAELPTSSVGSIWPTINDTIEFKAGNPLKTLITINLRREPVYNSDGSFSQYETFAAGDSFTITAPFISSLYSSTFSGSVGLKGKIASINALDGYQTIGGYAISDGDRVLVKNNPSADNGIYIVKSGVWERASDFDGSTAVANARVWVSDGINAGSLFSSSADGTGFKWILTQTNTNSNTNDWQQSNFWLSRDELGTANINASLIVQATRPIIEYFPDIELNSHFTDAGPSNSGTYYYQAKTKFNQVPLFNVYRYDGTHSGTVSSIFFYVEDATSEIDPQLQRRVKFASNLSNDFVFDDGLHNANGTTLFYKKSNALKSIWEAGYSSPELVDQVFEGEGNGSLTVDLSGVSPYITQQIWTLTAISPTQFSVVGSKNKVINSPYDIITVGVQYQYLLFKALIAPGSVPFVIGDTFTFRVGNLQTARYARVLDDGSLCDVCGGFENDVNVIGAWQVPPMFYSNIYGASGNEIAEGTLNSHLRGILANQPKGTTENRAFGGSIRLWSEPVNLLTSLMMQRDMTPISLVDLAERQYSNAVTSIISLFQKNVMVYVTANGVIDSEIKLKAFVQHLLSLRALDYDVKTVLYDSTSPVVGFPATLPQLGVSPLSVPGIVVDNELDIVAMRRHDGSLYPLYVNTPDFLDQFIPPGTVMPQDLASLLNDVLLQIELQLFSGISAQHRTYFSSADVETGLTGPLASYMHQELATWASQNGYDPIAGDYQPSNPFTWNYSQLDISDAAAIADTVPARWFNFLKSHQSTVADVIPTSRPDLEPWKLVGINEDPGAAWDIYRADVSSALLSGGYVVRGDIRLVLKSDIPLNTSLFGLPQIDGVQTLSGDTVLLVSEFLPQNNGLWIVSAGNWTRSDIELIEGTIVEATDGQVLKGSLWYLTNTVLVVNADPVSFSCIRKWTSAMWADIASIRPGLVLSVSPETDALLPPYISASSPLAAYSLTNTIPAGVANSYNFGESSPVETAWTKTSEYRYSLARALFRKDPLGWLSHLWGFEWITVDGISYNAPDVSMPITNKLPLHGETSSNFGARYAPLQLASATGPESTVIAVRDAFTSSGKQGWTIKSGTGLLLGTIIEGVTYASLTSNGFTFVGLRIEDDGIPFSIGDTIAITVSGVSSSYVFYPIGRTVILGFGQTFAHSLRNSSIDQITSYALKAYRGWSSNLSYRAGGLVIADDLKVSSDSGPIPETAYDLRLKRSRYVKDSWLQALRVTVSSFGKSIGNENGFYPATDASDWTFRIEGYNDRYLGISYHELDTTGDFVTFNVLDQAATKLSWKQFTTVLSTQQTQLPITITGLQNLITFVLGYESKLVADGWRFSDPLSSTTDPETGRSRSWILEIEKLIDRMYRGIDKDQGAVINPFIDTVWFDHEAGILTELHDTALFDVYGDPAFFDVFGAKVKSNEVTVLRQRERSKISTSIPIFSAHIQLDEIEHMFVFENFAEPSIQQQLIYDAFSGARIVSLRLNGRIQGNGTLRPEIGGYFLDENQQVKRNIQSSIDGVATLYDSNKVFEDSATSKHALALLGFSLKDYMSDLDLTDKSQFNFWRGLIHMKGTNESIDAFLNNGRFQETKLDEFWAYKVAEYGDNRTKLFPELKLNVADTIQQFTKLQFDTTEPIVDFTQISSLDENRWFNLDDLSESNKFDAIQNGKFEFSRGTNLADCSWWEPNAPVPIGWSIFGSAPESRIISDSSYYSETAPLWQAEAGAGGSSIGAADGGWDFGSFSTPIDRTKAYRFMLPVKRVSSQDGTLRFGVYGVSDLNEPNEAVDPSFVAINLPQSGVWYMAVGYVYPLGSTGNTHATAGLYRISDKSKIATGENFNWHDIIEISHHAKLISSEVGATIIMGKPMIHAIDGFEPTTDELFDGVLKIVKLDFVSDTIVIDGDARKLNDTTIQFITPAPEKTTVVGYSPDNKKFSPVKLINYVDEQLVEEIPTWHPAAGIFTPSAIESVNIISDSDPARYNVSTLVAGNKNYDPLRVWGSKEVGRIWLDTTALKYIPYFDSTIFPGIEERINRWGALADYGSIDVVEWVESNVPPTEYEAQAAIDAGDADVVSNTKADGTVYGSQTFYRERQWQIAPIAWSYAGRPIEAAHIGGMIGSRGSFNTDYDAGLYLLVNSNGVGEAIIDDGTFASKGIVEGMHFGEFEDTPSNLRALSENVITGFTKSIFVGTGDDYTVLTNGERLNDATGELNGLNATINVTVDAESPLVGDLLVSSRVETIPLYDFDGVLSGQQIVKSYLRVRVPGTSLDAEALVREDTGETGVQLYVINTAAVLAGIQQAATGLEPGNTLFAIASILGRSIADIDDSGLVESFDVDIYQNWIDGVSIDPAHTEYIEQTLHAFILANISTYADYVEVVDIVASESASLVVDPGQVFNISLPNIGMTITILVNNTEQIEVPSTTLSKLVANELSVNRQVRVFDAAQYQVVVSSPYQFAYLTNDFSNPAAQVDPSGQGGIGWRSWNVPSQAQLDADSKYPNSSWYPMVGPVLPISAPTIEDIQQIDASGETFTLNNGLIISRYSSIWNNWTSIEDAYIEAVQTSTGPLDVEIPANVPTARISVYINGSSIFAGTYSLVGTTLTVGRVIAGHSVTVIIRAYAPSAEELEFDPSIEDDALIQRQYKIDYPYVELPIRDSNGTISAMKYFFWVKNRSTIAKRKKLSVKAIEQQLRNGPDQHMSFQNIKNSDNEFYFDSLIISGLSYLVSKDDTFKLRFTRDYTLRDDPEGLNLKDTHTEWKLIRPNQRTKIPEKLWLKMVDTACALDMAGNVLPSARRVAYDIRNGSSTRFGFGPEQILAEPDVVKSTLLFTILNTKLVDSSNGVEYPDYMTFLDFSMADSWFSTPDSARSLLTLIWNKAKVSQINELFFAVLEDIAVANYEMTDIFKTSRLSVQSVRSVETTAYTPTYD